MPTVTTSATGQVTGEPNKAIVRCSVLTSEADANTARTDLASQTRKLRSALDELAIPSMEIRVTRYDINERPSRREDEAHTPRYRARQQFTIEIADLDQVGHLIDTATEHGVNQVDEVSHTFTEPKRRRLRNEALHDAMENARQQADTIAAQGRLTITGVESVDTTEVNATRRRTAGVTMDAASASDTKIDAGALRVTADVTVTYAAEQASDAG